MNNYIKDTKYATDSLINILNVERNKLAETLENIKKFRSCAREIFENNKTNFTFEDAIEIDSFERAAQKKETEVTEIKDKILNTNFSLNSISGALLQIAKQGISIVYKDLSLCPNGKSFKNECLKNIIWHGRNQSMHFEEGKYNQSLKKCFDNLQKDFDIKFSLNKNPHKNLAYDIILLLGWNNHENYENDMKSILG